MKSSASYVMAILLLSLAGIASSIELTISISILRDLLNDFPHDLIEDYSTVSPTTNLLVTILFMLLSLFLLIKGILNAIRLRYKTTSVYSIVLIAVIFAQFSFYQLTTAHYG